MPISQPPSPPAPEAGSSPPAPEAGSSPPAPEAGRSSGLLRGVAVTLVATMAILLTAGGASAAPQLSIAVDNGHASAATGDTLTYAITVRNLATTPVTRLQVTQSMPAGLTFGSADAAGSSGAGSVRWQVDVVGGGVATLHSTMIVAATPRELLRLATVACASTAGTEAPIVCASDSDLLPAGADAEAARAATESRRAPSSSGHSRWLVAAAAGSVLAIGALAVVAARRRSAPADR